ncbi:MAG: L-threonylcarbamoyladenylate synthase [Burkholderiaceae bacterium]
MPRDIQATITHAAQRLAAGELVAFPTETVYGLGADAMNPHAVEKIYALKGRPSNHPLIVHVPLHTDLGIWAADVPRYAQQLIDVFWPGPLTLVLRKAGAVPGAVTGGQDTIGLRCPAHPVAQALLAEFARIGSGGVAAPSANRFGHVSPTTAQHVRDEFGDQTPLLLDGGACDVGIESTIVDCTGAQPVLLRPGQVTRAQIAVASGLPVAERHADSPRVSGALPAHYQPATRVVLVHDSAQLPSGKIALFGPQRPSVFAGVYRAAPTDASAYANVLYATLRELDMLGLDAICIVPPPRGEQWEAIHDRLQRAAA